MRSTWKDLNIWRSRNTIQRARVGGLGDTLFVLRQVIRFTWSLCTRPPPTHAPSMPITPLARKWLLVVGMGPTTTGLYSTILCVETRSPSSPFLSSEPIGPPSNTAYPSKDTLDHHLLTVVEQTDDRIELTHLGEVNNIGTNTIHNCLPFQPTETAKKSHYKRPSLARKQRQNHCRRNWK